LLYEYIGRAGHITNKFGSGRPESGSEHIFAKTLEKIVDIPHGMSVAVGIVMMSMLHQANTNEIVRALRKVGILDNLRDSTLTRQALRTALLRLKPRIDRYTVINEVVFTVELAEKLLNRFEELTGVRLP
jgi:glycerol dehydrogenase-like iron-containing ADH family enzyme